MKVKLVKFRDGDLCNNDLTIGKVYEVDDAMIVEEMGQTYYYIADDSGQPNILYTDEVEVV